MADPSPLGSARALVAEQIVAKHKRHVEQSPAVDAATRYYACVVLDDVLSDLIPALTRHADDLAQAQAELAAERETALNDPVEQRAERYALEAADLTTRLIAAESALAQAQAERDAAWRETGMLRDGVTRALGMEWKGVCPDDVKIIEAVARAQAETARLREALTNIVEAENISRLETQIQPARALLKEQS